MQLRTNTNMKNTMKYLIAVLPLLAASIPAYAQQNTLTQTTLGAAVTASATLVQLASTTGVTTLPNVGYNTSLYVDQELMTVIGINQTAAGTNGLVVTVARGQQGTRAAAHSSGQTVYAGRPSWFYSQDPPAGTCVLANVIVTPWINYKTGNQWHCPSVTLMWAPWFGNPGNSAMPLGIDTLVASANGTVTITGPLFHINGTNAITSFTIPVGGVGQGFCVIPDAAFTTTATNNIAVASTGVLNKTICWTWDGTNSKYTASY